MDLIRSWVDIEEGKGAKSSYCVIMNVRSLAILCGIVWSAVL